MHLMSSAHAEQQLAQLANQFAHWRQSRTTRFEHIPAPLWEQAIALSQVYRWHRSPSAYGYGAVI